jgi:hypothetical protein
MDVFFNDSAAWFTVPAFIGTGIFVIRVVLMFAGVHDLSADAAGADHNDASDGFKVLSVQSLAAFAMGFGWGGLGAYRGQDWSIGVSTVVALAAGAAMVWFLGLMLKAVYDMHSSGNVDIRSAVGREGDVYVTVPGGAMGRGQVRVTIDQQQRIYNAVTNGEDLPTTTRVRVTRANDDNTLTVARA